MIEYFVKASRNQTTVRLPAPEGQAEAIAMMGHLVNHGWHHCSWVFEPRTVIPEPDTISKVWPECDRCTRKHSPFNHEAEGCAHCMAICRKPIKGKSRAKTAAGRIKAGTGMSMGEFNDWLGSVL